MNIPSSLMNHQQQPMISSDDYRRLSLRKRNICNYNETENDDDYNNHNNNERSGTFYEDHDNHKKEKKKHQSRKAVQQLDPQTKNVVAQYPSLTSAANAMQVTLPAICMAISKYKQQVYAKSAGFLWRHAPEEELKDSDDDNDNDDSSSVLLLLLEPGGNEELDNLPLSSSKNKEEAESSASIMDDNVDVKVDNDATPKMENKRSLLDNNSNDIPSDDDHHHHESIIIQQESTEIMVVSGVPASSSSTTCGLPPNVLLPKEDYIPKPGDRFRVLFDMVKDWFGERKEATGWYTGTATDVTLWDDKKYLINLRFDDHSHDKFMFPAADIQRLLPASTTTTTTKQAASNNQVFAFDDGQERQDGALLLQVAYEYSPDRIQVGDVVCCNYQADTKAEGRWQRGRVAKVHHGVVHSNKNGKCDVLFDDGDHHCKIPKKRLRLMERGRDTKGWVVGLSIKLQEHRRFGKLTSAKILRVEHEEDDERVVLMFPNWLEIYRPYEQVAVALMREALEKVKVLQR